MADPVDSSLFPRVAAYLRGLPDGVRSYPQCTARGSLVRSVLEEKPLADLPPGSLPESILKMAAQFPPASSWITEAELMCLSLAFADYHRLTDSAYLARKYEQNRKLFQGMIFRLIVSVSSPGMMVGVAGSRWNAVHRGSDLAIERSGKNDAEVRLKFPLNLYNELLLQLYAQIFRAVLESSNAKMSLVKLLQFDPVSAKFSMTWT